CMQALDFPWSF
nr:immunoglobulin light chain junction region [Macaca mulatta]